MSGVNVTFDAIWASQMGPTHLKTGQPNQDAIVVENIGKGELILSLADGHGSKTCFRSHLGSQFATVAMVQALKEDHDILVAEGLLALKTDSNPNYGFIRRTAEKVLKAWVIAVMSHLREHPFTSLEVDLLDEKMRRDLGHNALLAYGSTLLGVLVTPQLILGFNLGDGDILVYEEKNVKSFTYHDDHTLGNHTYSLCTSGSLSKLKYVLEPANHLNALFLATDGYRNSYRTEKGFLQVGTDMMKLYGQHGFKVLDENLPGWLLETTQGGSGDDITAAFVFMNKETQKPQRPALFKSKPKAPSRQRKKKK